MATLREAKCGQTVKVVKVHGEGAVKRRIMDMGITKMWRSSLERWLLWVILLR